MFKIKFKGFIFLREKAGVISKNKIWVILDAEGYFYTGETLFRLFKQFLTEFRHDKHLVG